MMNEKLAEKLAELNPEAMLADGFDDAILGMCIQFGSQPIIAYDFNIAGLGHTHSPIIIMGYLK